MDYWDPKVRESVQAMIPEVEGKPCVNVGGHDGLDEDDPNHLPTRESAFVCRRISGLGTDEDCFNGQCDWVDAPDARPEELTDGMAISCDCVRLGPGWWQDMYFRWYFVYDPVLVARSLAGDHSWVPSFLASADQGQGRTNG
jgi:hypothetical protein